MRKHEQASAEHQSMIASHRDWMRNVAMQQRKDKQLNKLSYQDRVAKCISEIRACEKALNKKLSELNKLLKIEDASRLVINDDAAMSISFPQQSFMGGNSLPCSR